MNFKHYISKSELKDNPDLKEDFVSQNNQQYIENNINDSIFTLKDNVTLDYNQRVCILTDEDAVLLIAGAGSGKTTTIQGKIRYLIERKKVRPDQILCISFTRKAKEQLKEKLSIYNNNIHIHTFHSLGLDIIKKSTLKQVKIVSDKALEAIVLEIIKNEDNKEYLEKNILTFINRFKSNQYKIEDIKKWLAETKSFEHKKFYKLVLEVLKKYNEYLKLNDEIDFEDMIIKATEYLKNNNYYNYKYIIIDEYQDISYTRYKLIETLKIKSKAKLLAVGDDWQSIYGFSGSRIDLFTNFSSYFQNSKILYLKSTYRNSQQLLDITTKFILKNPNQVKKQLSSIKSDSKPIIFIYNFKIVTYLKKLLPKLDGPLLILGRNQNDINLLKDKEIKIKKDGTIICKEYEAKYLTVHKSKGLESDYVLIINMKNDILGFPSQIKEDSCLNKVTPKLNYYPYEEERRLFYVALTRCKKKVYIHYPIFKPSIFVCELKKQIKNK